MYDVFLTPASQRHFRAIDPLIAFRLAMLIKELVPRMGPLLGVEGGNHGLAEARRFQALQREGYDVWRLKLHGPFAFEDPPNSSIQVPVQLQHRILYATRRSNRGFTVFILAVADRDQYDYEPDHPITEDARREYRGQGFSVQQRARRPAARKKR